MALQHMCSGGEAEGEEEREREGEGGGGDGISRTDLAPARRHPAWNHSDPLPSSDEMNAPQWRMAPDTKP